MVDLQRNAGVERRSDSPVRRFVVVGLGSPTHALSPMATCRIASAVHRCTSCHHHCHGRRTAESLYKSERSCYFYGVSKGQQTREAVLDVAVAAASTSGLSAISIGDLARTVGMSKSGLFAHFESKENLQLEVL